MSMLSRTMVALAALGCALAVGCDKPHIGLCGLERDELDQLLVFEGAGLPAFDGQAQMEIACANACHVTGVPDRMGAPHGFDFDVVGSLTDDPTMPDMAAVEAVQRTRQFVFDGRYDIYGSVQSGRMPPAEAGATVASGVEYVYVDERPLPPIATAEGLETFRRWLACGAPMVERAAPSVECTDPEDPMTCMQIREPGVACTESDVGDYCYTHNVAEPVPAIFSDPATGRAIFEAILEPRCSACHRGNDPDNGPLDFTDPDRAYDTLIVGSAEASGEDCGGPTEPPYVVSGNSAGSLLVHKLTGVDEDMDPVCGGRMPSERGIAPLYVVTIRAWIDAGAAR